MTSPPQPDPAAAVGAAQTLADALNGLSERLDTATKDSETRDASLTKYGRVNRRRIWLSYAGLAVDVALTVGLGFFAVQAHNASATANQTRVSSITACQSTNVARAENEQLWDYVLTLFTPRSSETAAEKAAGDRALAMLRPHVAGTFAPRDCVQIYGGGHG